MTEGQSITCRIVTCTSARLDDNLPKVALMFQRLYASIPSLIACSNPGDFVLSARKREQPRRQHDGEDTRDGQPNSLRTEDGKVVRHCCLPTKGPSDALRHLLAQHHLVKGRQRCDERRKQFSGFFRRQYVGRV